MVYVLSKTGKALTPTQRNGKVRRLLSDGLAVVVKLEPFTIQLCYETTELTQPVTLGADAGTGHVGLSATTESKELFAAEVILRTDIVKLLSQRGESRRTRRNRKTRFQRYDKVIWNGVKCFIAGSTGGRPVLRNMDWTLATPTASINAKTITFLSRKRGGYLMQTI